MDPFVYLIVGRQQQQSISAKDQGRNPRWNQEFIFTVEPASMSELTIRIFDQSTLSNDFIGGVAVPLATFRDCTSKGMITLFKFTTFTV